MSKTKNKWYKPQDKLPEEGYYIKWLDSNGNEIKGKFYKNKFWLINRWGR